MRGARGSLAWKLYAIGLVQLVLLAGVFVGVGRIVMGAPPSDDGPTPRAFAPPPHDDRPRFAPPPHVHHAPLISAVQTLFLGGFVILGIGSLLTARSIVKPLEDLARAARALGSGDLHARSGIRRNDEIGELARTFDDMGERIARLVLAEKELLANVSHELRTPLARLRVALDIAGEADAEGGRVSMADMAIDLAELEALIDDILTATRLEIAGGTSAAAHFELHLAEARCDALCERATARFRLRHPTRPLLVDVDRELPMLHADPVLFRRVLDNLLENADKYSPEPTTPITLRATRSDGGVAFEVVDRGMGVAEADLPHLFAPFFRGEKSRARGLGGVGLGLTLAKRIVEAHDGTISVTSALGAGTTLRVVVPAAGTTAPLA
jgi:two-component system OmpR family sensor kinase